MSIHTLSIMGKDEVFIKRCLELAKKGTGHVSPNPLVGCVIVRDGKIIAQGYHHKYGEKHAEIDALDKIAGKAKGATLYVNLEPCSIHGKTPPCTKRIIKEKIGRVVVGCSDKNPLIFGNGIAILKAAGIEVLSGVLDEKCRMINQFFFKRITLGLPYITLKMAVTCDNFVAPPDGSRMDITGEESIKEVHRLRALYDAVLVGKGTVLSDDPSLTVRHVKGRQPFRIVLDSKSELKSSSRKIFTDKHAKKTIVKTGKNLLKMLKELTDKNISSILVEGGPRVWQSFLDADLVDQVIIFTSPKRLKEGVKVLPNSKISNIKYKKIERENFGDDKMERMYVNIY